MEEVVAKYVLVFGLIIILSIFIKYGFKLLNLPTLVGYFLLGAVLHMINKRWFILEDEGIEILEFLADIGIVAMLLKIGLESNITALIKWLPKASIIWLGDVVFSGLLGFVTGYYLIGWGLIPSLFVGTAFTATSVGISGNIWDEMHLVHTTTGQTLFDVAELDDISGILFMGILFSVVPVIQEGGGTDLGMEIVTATGIFLVKLIAFGIVCLLFSRYVAELLIELLQRLHGKKSSMLVIVGLGLVVAALSGLLGFSFAIGAFLVGVLLSGNPTKVKIDTSFDAIFALFVPFFFISIGYTIDVLNTSIVWTSLGLLAVAAFIGKLVGAGLGTWVSLGIGYSGIIGLSMIPRAEIFLIIMKKGYELGSWAVTNEIFTYAVIISALSAVIVPVLLRMVLVKKHKQLMVIET